MAQDRTARKVSPSLPFPHSPPLPSPFSLSPLLILPLAHMCLVLISDDAESILPVAQKTESMSWTLGTCSSNPHTSGANTTGQSSNYFPTLSSVGAPVGMNFCIVRSWLGTHVSTHSLPTPDPVTSYKLCLELKVSTSLPPKQLLWKVQQVSEFWKAACATEGSENWEEKFQERPWWKAQKPPDSQNELWPSLIHSPPMFLFLCPFISFPSTDLP